ncbi:MAG: hypothetical protein RSB98_04755 [Raoultibacter sp.]
MMEGNAARVTKLTEYGDKRMSEAIAQGLVSGEVRREIERAQWERQEALRNRDAYKTRNVELEAIRRDNTRERLEVYREWLNGKRRYNAAKVFFVVGFIAGEALASFLNRRDACRQFVRG